MENGNLGASMSVAVVSAEHTLFYWTSQSWAQGASAINATLDVQAVQQSLPGGGYVGESSAVSSGAKNL